MENPRYKIAWNYSKITSIVLNIIFSAFKNSLKNYREYIRMENPSCKIIWNHSKITWIDGKYLHNMQKNQFLKVKNSFLETKKDFIELKDK